MRKFYDLRVEYKKGEAKKIIERALELEFKGICLVHNFQNLYGVGSYLKEIERLRKEFGDGIDIITGVMVEGKKERSLLEKIIKLRRKVEVIFVNGKGNYKINRFACSRKEVDILCNFWDKKGIGIDHICIRNAKKNLVFFEISLAEYLENRDILIKFRECARVFKKSNAPVIITSGAKDVFGLRKGRDLASLLSIFDYGLEKSLEAISALPESLVRENRKKLKQPVIGVEVLENEKEEA